jgi:hypothetical protein
MTERKFHRTIIQAEVLSESPIGSIDSDREGRSFCAQPSRAARGWEGQR